MKLKNSGMIPVGVFSISAEKASVSRENVFPRGRVVFLRRRCLFQQRSKASISQEKDHFCGESVCFHGTCAYFHGVAENLDFYEQVAHTAISKAQDIYSTNVSRQKTILIFFLRF